MGYSRIFIILTMSFAFLYSSICSLPISSAQEAGEKEGTYTETAAPCISSECHPRMGGKKYIHKFGLKQNALDPNACEKCHEIIQPGEYGSRKIPEKTAGLCVHRFREIPEKTAGLCMKCHDKNSQTPSDVLLTPPKILFTGENINWHKPFAEGKCTICHDAHESDFLNHLKAEYPETPYASYSSVTYRLCFTNQCHQELQNDLEIPRILSGTGFRNGNLNLHYKHVNRKKGRTCRTCHRIHGSPFPDLMTDSFVFGTRKLILKYEQTDTGGSCKTPCHYTGGYDRYKPVLNIINSSPTPGRDATQEELETSRIGNQNKQQQQNQ